MGAIHLPLDLLQLGLGGWCCRAATDYSDLVLPQGDQIIIILGVGSSLRWLLLDWAFGLTCLFFLPLLLLVDQTIYKAMLGRTVNRAIDGKVLRFTLSSWQSLSFSYGKDFSFSLALLVLVLLLIFSIGLSVHSGSGIGCLCYCIENLVELSDRLRVFGG